MEYTSNSYTTSPFISENNPDSSNQSNINNIPHKGIFHPHPNIFICKPNCCFKYIGLYIILFGSLFGIFFPIAGIATKFIVFIIVGSVIFLCCLIVGIILFCLITIEIKFTFSHPMVEITASSMCRKKKQFVEKSEISEIFFEYNENRLNGRKGRKKIYHALHIKFKNGIENNYLKFSSNPPCFTKEEVDYFNNEMKKFLSSNYSSY